MIAVFPVPLAPSTTILKFLPGGMTYVAIGLLSGRSPGNPHTSVLHTLEETKTYQCTLQRQTA